MKDINATPESSTGGPGEAIVAGNTLYFTVSNMLWKSDGTAAGTQPVNGTGAIPGVRFQAVLGDILYFTANDGGHGIELWRTDGTLEGTEMIRDINPGRGNSEIRSLVAFRGELYFGANDGVHGLELWKTDGTKDGTVLAADLNPGPSGSALLGLAASGDRLYFSEGSFAPGSPSAFYSTDGTASGTRLVRQFVSTITSCYFEGCAGWPPLLQVVNGRLVFFANDGVHGSELWTSDGTEAGTRLVKDIFPGPLESTFGYGATVVGGELLFPARSNQNGWELWRSDGTEAGTFAVGSGPGDSMPTEITPVGDAVFFSAVFVEPRSSGPGIRRLWKTDAAGSRATIVSDSVSDPTRLANLGGTLYFTAPGPAGFSLWKTDGSSAGTEVVQVVSRKDSSSWAFPLGELGGSLLFFTTDGKESSGLWRSDGTESGTQPVAPVSLDGGLDAGGVFAPFQRSLFFSGNDVVHGSELWAMPLSALDSAPGRKPRQFQSVPWRR